MTNYTPLRDVATQAGVPLSTLRSWCASGRILFCVVTEGGHYRFPSQHTDAVILGIQSGLFPLVSV